LTNEAYDHAYVVFARVLDEEKASIATQRHCNDCERGEYRYRNYVRQTIPGFRVGDWLLVHDFTIDIKTPTRELMKTSEAMLAASLLRLIRCLMGRKRLGSATNPSRNRHSLY
jgi:hypothetical protein